MKKIFSLIIITIFILCHVSANEIYSYEEIIPIAEGITLTKAEAFYSGHNISYSYITADLTNENIGLTLLKSDKGMDYAETTLSLSNSEEDVVAALNADFFSHVGDKTISLGIEIKDGIMLQSPINPETMATVASIDGEILMNYLDFHIMVVAPNYEYAEVAHLNKHTSYYGNILMYTKDFNGGYSPAPGGEVLEVVVEDGIISEFRRNAPPCLIPENGCVLSVSEGSSMFFSNNFKVGDEIKFDYYITPNIKDADFAFGGGAVLVSEGKALTEFSHSVTGYNPRSAIGLSKDGNTLYLLAVNGRQTKSRGMTMQELASLLVSIGCHNAVNLDGGGSTSMVASTVWAEKLHTVNSPSETRRVINAIGLTYKNSDEEIEPYGIILKNEKSAVFIGESVKISSAIYDEKMRPTAGDIKWSSSAGTVDNGIFKAEKGGMATIHAACGKAAATTEIFVVDEISGIDAPDLIKLTPGKSSMLSLNVFDSEGHFVSVNNLEPFEITSDNPEVVSVENGKITALSAGTGIITIKKDEVASYISVVCGEAREAYTEDFESLSGSFASYPAYVGGDYYISDKFYVSGEHSGALSFDFTSETEDSKAAYYVLDKSIDTALSSKISLSVYTENDFNHEIRVLLEDSKKKEYRITLGKDLSGGTWHNLAVKTPDEAAAPLTLKRIYALYQNGEVQDSGTLYMDDLLLEKTLPLSPKPKDKNIYKDSAEKLSGGIIFRIGALSSDNSTLINRLADVEMKKVTGKADYYETLGEGKGFSVKNTENALFITLDTKKGGIRASLKNQWDLIKKAIDESSAKYLFITSDYPVFGNDEFENKVIKDYFASLSKTVTLIEKGTSDTLRIINGVRYFTIADIKGEYPLSSRVDNLSYLEFYLGDTLSYTYNKLFIK